VLLPALAAVTFCQAFANPLLALAHAQRLGGFLLAGNVLALVVNAAVAIALIPVMGLAGAVLATTAAQLTTVAFLARQQIRRNLLSWRQLLHTGLPLWLACIAVGFPAVVAADGQGDAVVAGAWVAAALAWLVMLRGVLGEGVRADLASLAPSTPRAARPAIRALMQVLSVGEHHNAPAGRSGGDASESRC
jgi:O-antigen/teichoic acid export membrane protein